MEAKTVARPLALLSALMSLMFAPAPSASSRTLLGESAVCATGTCCNQFNSICNDGGQTEFNNKYYLSSGQCPGGW